MGIQNVSHTHIHFQLRVVYHLCREYSESGSGSDDETEKSHSKDDLLESEFRKRRIKVANSDGHVICDDSHVICGDSHVICGDDHVICLLSVPSSMQERHQIEK